MDYAAAIDYLLSLSDMERGHQASGNPTMNIQSVRSLLARLNNPQNGRHTVHVTGSKGKGSTSAMIAGILAHNETQVSLFTSPHLHSYTERIAINGDPITPPEFAAGLGAIQPIVEAERASAHGAVSTFGVLTALFFWLTRAQARRIEWQVVEVGLGGTFDATNVFESPDITVITPISLEHTAILGDTPVAIARDKAGIIKPGATCVLAPQQDGGVREVIRERCAEVGATLVDVAAEYEARVLERHVFGQSFDLVGPHGVRRELRTPMLGRHQIDNAATAVAVAEAIRDRAFPVSERAIVEGIAYSRLHGRLEVMGQRPLMIADGAHNGESGHALAAALRDYFEWRRCFFVLGCMADKDVRALVQPLAKLSTLIVCTGFNSPRAREPYALAQELGAEGLPVVAEETVAEALNTALSHASPDDLVCFTGSLYLVAEARELILGESVLPA